MGRPGRPVLLHQLAIQGCHPGPSVVSFFYDSQDIPGRPAAMQLLRDWRREDPRSYGDRSRRSDRGNSGDTAPGKPHAQADCDYTRAYRSYWRSDEAKSSYRGANLNEPE